MNVTRSTIAILALAWMASSVACIAAGFLGARFLAIPERKDFLETSTASVEVGNVHIAMAPGWTVLRRGDKEVALAHSGGGTLTISHLGRIDGVQSVMSRLRFESNRLLVGKNGSLADLYYHSVSKGGDVTYEGFIVADKRVSHFVGVCKESDRRSLSDLQHMLVYSRTAI